ncbi:MAG: DNA polymerase III subunit epsilon [Gammaproteobacteria bacterium]|nr:MAG: DNA polymerase III subunit epsilon [Gammaproteobacteria bacterium]
MRANTLIILDFETTGLSPNMGDRAIEIGAVRLRDGKLVDSFQELMNPGFYVDTFIENYTGITNEMLTDARPCGSVMKDFCDYIGDDNLVAHNASFDQRFLDAEFEEISRQYSGKFVCSMLLARRLYQESPNHQLGTLIQYKNIPAKGGFHRALFDAEMTSKLWLQMLTDLKDTHQLFEPTFTQVKKLSKTPKNKIKAVIEKWNQK